MSTEQQTATSQALPELVLGHNKGRTARAGSQKLSDVLHAVEETGKAGELTLTWKVKPQQGVGNAVLVTCEIKAKVPEHDAPASIYWIDSDTGGHCLSRNDPSQMTIDDL